MVTATAQVTATGSHLRLQAKRQSPAERIPRFFKPCPKLPIDGTARPPQQVNSLPHLTTIQRSSAPARMEFAALPPSQVVAAAPAAIPVHALEVKGTKRQPVYFWCKRVFDV